MSSGKSQMLLTLEYFPGCQLLSAHHRRVSPKVPFDSAEWVGDSNGGEYVMPG